MRPLQTGDCRLRSRPEPPKFRIGRARRQRSCDLGLVVSVIDVPTAMPSRFLGSKKSAPPATLLAGGNLIRCEPRLMYSAAQALFPEELFCSWDDSLEPTPVDTDTAETLDEHTDTQSGTSLAQHSLVDAVRITEQAAPPLANHLWQSLDRGAFAEDESLSPHTTAAQAAALTGVDATRDLYGLRGVGQTIAIIDSGVALDHVAFLRAGGGSRVVGGWDFAENDAVPYDDGPFGFHGTSVASVAAGVGGVAPAADLVALRVFDDYGAGSLAQVEAALRWVIDHRTDFASPISVVNLSLGTQWNSTQVPSYAILEDELSALAGLGVSVVASAGNSFADYQEPGLSYPAASPYVLPVASIDANGLFSSFTQRVGHAIAAPGSQLTAAVPDHVFGIDGRVDDYSSFTGTSAAAPYVAGAISLLREAANLAGLTPSVAHINHSIMATAQRFFDAATQAYYGRLDIDAAIAAILPADVIGNEATTAAVLSDSPHQVLTGLINSRSDVDMYRWTPTASGSLTLGQTDGTFSWSLLDSQMRPLASSGGVFSVDANQPYFVSVSAAASISSYELDWSFAPAASGGFDAILTRPAVDLGGPASLDFQADNGHLYRFTGDGDISTVQWQGVAAGAELHVFSSEGAPLASLKPDAAGVIRYDRDAPPGETLLLAISGVDAAHLQLRSVVDVVGGHVTLSGDSGVQQWGMTVGDDIAFDANGVSYRFARHDVSRITAELGGGSDRLTLQGSAAIETVHLRPTDGSLLSGSTLIEWSSADTVHFDGVGGADRVYAYDGAGNDEATISPHKLSMNGNGYRYEVLYADRIYVDASTGGEDHAFLFDSAGNDSLSVRPQFSSMRGSDYFNYVTGFERVYAYATAGGWDTATLYGSAGDDTFATSGDIASVVGRGYYSYTRYFESVEGVSGGQGRDIANLYSPRDASVNVGADFATFEYGRFDRTARGFNSVFAQGLPQSMMAATAGLSLGSTAAADEITTTSVWEDLDCGLSGAYDLLADLKRLQAELTAAFENWGHDA